MRPQFEIEMPLAIEAGAELTELAEFGAQASLLELTADDGTKIVIDPAGIHPPGHQLPLTGDDSGLVGMIHGFSIDRDGVAITGMLPGENMLRAVTRPVRAAGRRSARLTLEAWSWENVAAGQTSTAAGRVVEGPAIIICSCEIVRARECSVAAVAGGLHFSAETLEELVAASDAANSQDDETGPADDGAAAATADPKAQEELNRINQLLLIAGNDYEELGKAIESGESPADFTRRLLEIERARAL